MLAAASEDFVNQVVMEFVPRDRRFCEIEFSFEECRVLSNILMHVHNEMISYELTEQERKIADNVLNLCTKFDFPEYTEVEK